MGDHPGRGRKRTHNKRLGQRLAGAAAQLLVRRGEVEQIDRMKEQRQAVPLQAGGEGGDLLGRVGTRVPGPRIGGEDLYHLGPDRDRALRDRREAAGGGDLGPDERGQLAACRPLPADLPHHCPRLPCSAFTVPRPGQHIESVQEPPEIPGGIPRRGGPGVEGDLWLSGGWSPTKTDGRRDGAVNRQSRLKVWAVEPYFGGSHKYFLEGLARHSAHHLTLFTLPGRHWKWRMHGGALSLARRVSEGGNRGSAFESPGAGPPDAGPLDGGVRVGGPDVLFTSDMLDLPVFLSAVGPRVARAPAIVYFHENQLTYPLPPGVERDLGYGFKNLTSAAAAHTVLFNSEFHRRDFLRACAELLQAMPDEIPDWVVEQVEAKSRVLPVGCDLRRFDRHRSAAPVAGGRRAVGRSRCRAPHPLEPALGVRQGSGRPVRRPVRIEGFRGPLPAGDGRA